MGCCKEKDKCQLIALLVLGNVHSLEAVKVNGLVRIYQRKDSSEILTEIYPTRKALMSNDKVLVKTFNSTWDTKEYYVAT